MRGRLRNPGIVSAALAVWFGLSAVAFADGAHDRTQFGGSITVAAGEETGELTCFGCSVRVRGHVTGDVTVVGGSVVVEDQGQIDGDATVVAGGARFDKNVKVAGDVTVVGGQLRRDPTSSVGGDVTNLGGGIWMIVIFVLPLAIVGGFLALVVWLIRRLLRPAVPATA